MNSAVEAGFHWETGGIKKCRILRVSVPLPIAHVDGTVPFPDSIRKRDGLRIWRYPIKRGYFVVRPNPLANGRAVSRAMPVRRPRVNPERGSPEHCEGKVASHSP